MACHEAETIASLSYETKVEFHDTAIHTYFFKGKKRQ